MKLLIVEDESELLKSLMLFLKSEGHVCETAVSFAEAIDKVSQYEYDCVLADIGLPDGDGLDLIKVLKRINPQSGVIIISARNGTEEKITGLNIGADDYLTKPFNLSELNARLKSLMRRRKFMGHTEITFKEISADAETFTVRIGDRSVSLTKKEFDLLMFFISNVGKVLSKEAIVGHLWGDYADSYDNFDFIYPHISNLRKKLTDNGAKDYIHSVYRVGYKFADL